MIEKSAIDPRLIRDCAAIEEPPNVVTGPLPAHVSCPFLQGLARQGSAGCTSLWLVYISMYMKIVLLFSVHMTLERTKSLRHCHLWGRDWFAIDRRLYPSQEPLFWSTNYSHSVSFILLFDLFWATNLQVSILSLSKDFQAEFSSVKGQWDCKLLNAWDRVKEC